MTRWERWGAASGIIFFVLVLIPFVTAPEPPDIDSPAQQIAKHYVDKSGDYQVSDAFGVFAFVFFLWFLGSVRSALAAAEGGTARLSSIAFGSGLVGTAAVFAALTFTAAAAFNPEQTSPDVLRTLHIMNTGMFVGVGGMAFVAFLAAVAVATLRTGAMPAAVGWIAALGAILWIPAVAATWTGSGAFSANGVFGFLGFMVLLLWALVTSIVLVRRPVAPVSAGRVTPE